VFLAGLRYPPKLVNEIVYKLESRGGEIKEQLEVLGPLLEDYRVHLPVWSLVATRLD
jgi:hypothetical protein